MPKLVVLCACVDYLIFRLRKFEAKFKEVYNVVVFIINAQTHTAGRHTYM